MQREIQREQQGANAGVLVCADFSVAAAAADASIQAPPREHPVPHNLLSRDIWRPSIGLEEGMRRVWQAMRDAQQQQQQQQQQQPTEL
jgi:hypothetical protein